jgi:MFS family permease
VFLVRDFKRKPVKRGLLPSLHSLPKDFRKYLMVATLFGLGNFTYFFFIIKASSMFTGAMALIAPIGLYAIFNAVSTMTSPIFGSISDRLGRKKMIIAGYLLFALVCTGFAINGEMLGLVALFAVYGVFYALIDGGQRAFAVDIVQEHECGTALGAFHTAIAMAALPAGVIAGLLYTIAPALTFWWGATLAIFSAILLAIVVDNR